ncbi:MAG TPA: PKD domain-containing protein, partial [Methanosarcinaceae archaeon]|nr:PKD domain-containing protein [Methanosarcinaceae archaeon]
MFRFNRGHSIIDHMYTGGTIPRTAQLSYDLLVKIIVYALCVALVFGLLVGVGSAADPVADPNGPYTDTEGVSVTFDGSGSGSSDPGGSIDYYDWDFGDGNSGTGINPDHTYVQDGTYTVTLKVTDNDGLTDSHSTTATISDIEPVAGFTATPLAGPEPLTVVFTDTSTSYDGITS